MRNSQKTLTTEFSPTLSAQFTFIIRIHCLKHCTFTGHVEFSQRKFNFLGVYMFGATSGPSAQLHWSRKCFSIFTSWAACITVPLSLSLEGAYILHWSLAQTSMYHRHCLWGVKGSTSSNNPATVCALFFHWGSTLSASTSIAVGKEFSLLNSHTTNPHFPTATVVCTQINLHFSSAHTLNSLQSLAHSPISTLS